LQQAAGSLPKPLESPRTKAIAVPNNRCGAIRLNLQGREPFGSIEPGCEAAALLEELRRELLALEDPESGERIVKRVMTASEEFGPGHHPDLPDLMVVFRTDLGPLEECRSPRAGLVRAPIYRRNTPRTGDHTVESRLWALGPWIPGRTRLPTGSVLDLAPTVLRILDVELPGFFDGRPLLQGSADPMPA
jgi:predicted AlkP superfamily phosphohydrolase/phosphomutase